jgi:hypothetical protein
MPVTPVIPVHSSAPPPEPVPAAWQTAVNGVQGTVAKGFPRDDGEVLKYSFDHGKAVQTLIAGNSHGPGYEITDNLYSNTVKVIKLDPNTGEKTQYYETFTEDRSGYFKASGNLASANPWDSVDVASFLGGSEVAVAQTTSDGTTLDVQITDANPAVTSPLQYPSISKPSLWGPLAFVTAPFGDSNSNDVSAVWMNTGGAMNPQDTASGSEMITASANDYHSTGSFTSKQAHEAPLVRETQRATERVMS